MLTNKKADVKFFIYSLLFFQFLFANDYQNYLSICTIFKDEAPYLKEWIEYHKLVGVEHFYLYNNGSEDNYLEVLTPYIKANEVTLIDWPDRIPEEMKYRFSAWCYTSQQGSYEDAFKRARKRSKWVAAIDVDEFIVPVTELDIPSILKKYENQFPGVEVRWRLYGTSGYHDIPPNKLLIEIMNKKSFPEVSHNTVTKCIVRPEFYHTYNWPPHQCIYMGDIQPYRPEPEEIVINHYLNRSIRYFFEHKIKNKEKMQNARLSWPEINDMLNRGNDMDDTERTIHRYVPALREKMGFIGF